MSVTRRYAVRAEGARVGCGASLRVSRISFSQLLVYPATVSGPGFSGMFMRTSLVIF
jgi:hypothetical protein